MNNPSCQRWNVRLLFFTLFLVTSFIVSCKTELDQKTSHAESSPQQMLTGASRYEKNGWIFVHLEGGPATIGYQHGYLLANEILDLRGALSMLLEHDTKKNWDWYQSESLKLFWAKTPEEYRQEIDGIVSGANAKLGGNQITRGDIVAMNAMEEMAYYYVPWLESKNNPKAAQNKAPGNCSAFVATGSWTKDGKPVIAHNNWTSYVTGERWNVILDIVPQKGRHILMDAMPGFIHSGDDFNVNDAGIMVTETTITQFHGFDPNGIAEFVRARKAIQYANSIDDWVATMREGNNGGYANDWLLADNKTGEIARLELGLKNTPLERTKDGYFVGSNFPVSAQVLKEETTFDPKAKNTSPNARRVRWEELMKQNKGKIDIELAKMFESDHADTFRHTSDGDANSLCGHVDRDSRGTPEWDWSKFYPGGTVQSKAMDSTLAGQMSFWASMGHPCGQTFIAKDFLAQHPEYNWQQKYLRDMPGEMWTLFSKKQ
jgi:hypothetical protein